MDVNKLIKNAIWGISAIVGVVVAEGVYRAATSVVDKRNLIGDGEIISDEIKSLEETTLIEEEA